MDTESRAGIEAGIEAVIEDLRAERLDENRTPPSAHLMNRVSSLIHGIPDNHVEGSTSNLFLVLVYQNLLQQQQLETLKERVAQIEDRIE